MTGSSRERRTRRATWGGWLLAGLLACAAAPAWAAVTFRSAASNSTGSAGAIAHQGVGSVASCNDCDSITPSVPAGSAGDLLIALVVVREDGPTASMAGWTAYYADAESGRDFQVAIYWRIATGGDPSTVSLSSRGDSVAARISRFSSVDVTSPFDAGPAAARDNSNDIDTGTITTTSPTAMAIVATFVRDNRTVTEGSGWSQSFDSSLNLDKSLGMSLNYQLQSTAGSKSISNWDISGNSSERNYGVIFALKPSGGGLTLAKPTGTIAGDVMIASVSAATSSITVTPPAGWTLLRRVNQGSANASVLATYYKVAAAGEPASYTWSFSAGTHSGAAGAIASFSGVDNSNPIDVEAGAATASDMTHTAPSLTTTQADGMLVTVHEFASSGVWTSPAGMTEAAQAAIPTPDDASGISMQMNYEARPTAGATGTRSATASGCILWFWCNFDPGATQSIALRPTSAPLICYTDDFNRANGAPGSGWVVSHNDGTFGDPVIQNGRLRLTDESGNAATMATLQRLFPGAGNRIEVEFEHFAYNGTGADGIALVLSDSAIAPAPGGYGGSLGYAQRNDPPVPGFAGGWLGVAIDEYGNFANPNEGRLGGPGLRVDSVTVRGSGTGTTGYRYHTTTGTLSPQVDNNGSASPPHKYRIIIDHTNGVNAWVSVERDTGAGYQTLIAPYDAKAQAGQAAVPTNWMLSYTGSTGGSTNIHEIDNLSVCAVSQMPVTSVHHIRIEHDGGGLTCASESITLKACADAACTTLYNSGNTSVTLAGSGWSSNPVVFTGSTTVNLSITSPQTVSLAASSVSPAPAEAADCFDGAAVNGTTACQLPFADSGFLFSTIPTQTAGAASGSLTVQAVRKADNSAACVGMFTGPVAVEMASQCVDPATCAGRQVSIDGAAIANNPASAVSTYTPVTLNFGANSTATFSLNYPDVGQMRLAARRALGGGDYMSGTSGAFVVKPFGFTLSGIRCTLADATNCAPGALPSGNNPGAANAAGASFIPAGRAFSATVTAVTAAGAATPNYGKEATPEGVRLTANLAAPAGGNNPGLANAAAFGAFTSGVATGTTFSWNEVGIVTLTPRVGDGDYLGAGEVVGTTSGNVGRFVPVRFAFDGAALTNRADLAACTAPTFSYLGEPMRLAFRLLAQDAGGTTLSNYTGAFAKLSPAVPEIAFGLGARSGTTDLSGRLTASYPSGTPAWANGVLDLTGGVPLHVTVARAAAPEAPLPGAQLGIAPVDSDGVRLAAYDLDVNNDTSNDHVATGGTTELRYGRISLQSGSNAEIKPVRLPLLAQYYTTSGWVTNANDSCTTLDLASQVRLSNASASNQTGTTPMSIAAATTSASFVDGTALMPGTQLLSGDAGFSFSAVAAGNTGYVDVDLDLGGTPWLQFDWNNDGTYTDNPPRVRASFGIWRGSNHMIYMRERY